MRSQRIETLPPGIMEELHRAVRKMEKRDLPGLVEVAFGETVGFTTLLLIRCQLHVERRLAQCDQHSGDPTHIPADLDDDGWLARIERISRFLMEVCSTHARVEHVSRLNNGRQRTNVNLRWLDATSPMDGDPTKAGAGKGLSGNGRLRGQEGGFTFP